MTVSAGAAAVPQVRARGHLVVPASSAISRVAPRPTVAVAAVDEGRDLRHSLALVVVAMVDGMQMSGLTAHPVLVAEVVAAATTSIRDTQAVLAAVASFLSVRKCLRWGCSLS